MGKIFGGIISYYSAEVSVIVVHGVWPCLLHSPWEYPWWVIAYGVKIGIAGQTFWVRIALVCAPESVGFRCRKAGAEQICRRAAATSCGERFSTDIVKCVV